MRAALLACALLLPAPAWAQGASAAPVLSLSAAARVELERNLRWSLRRARAGLGPAARVGVFVDAGVWHLGARSLVESLERAGVPCRTLLAPEVRSARLRRLEALVVPGGWAPDQARALGAPGIAAIRSYVRAGGRYLGVCAGAYLASREVRWAGIRYPYPLGLWGQAEGPVAGLARWPGSCPVRLRVTPAGRAAGLNSLRGPALYFGGGHFPSAKPAEVLARYASGGAAVVRARRGKGWVVLTGPHFERPARGLGPAPAGSGALLVKLLGLPARPR